MAKVCRKEINSIWKSICDRRSLPKQYWTQLSTSTCRTQKFYHLLKTHKPGTNVRPIISAKGGPFDRIGWFLQNITSPLLSQVQAHLQDSAELLRSVNSLVPSSIANKYMISLDVKSMYTNIPISEAINVSIEYIHRYKVNTWGLMIEDIEQLLQYILEHNVFEFNGKYYKQHKGLAMGSRIAPIRAILVMNKLERDTTFNNPPLSVYFYKRYVDDTFILVDDKTRANQLHEYINNQPHQLNSN